MSEVGVHARHPPAAGESGLARIYAEAARDPVELWILPTGRHTAALRERPDEYERRVVGLFDERLLESGTS